MNHSTAPAQGSATPAHLLSANSDKSPVGEVEYFVALDYSFLDKWLGVLSGNALRVLIYLRRRRGANLEAHPKKRTIAKDLKLSEKTVERMIDELAAHRIIEARAYFDAERDGRQCANRYHFLVETHILYPRPLPKVTPPPPTRVAPPNKERQGEGDSSREQQPEVAASKDKSSVSTPAPAVAALLARMESEAGLNAAAAIKMLKMFGIEKVTLQLNYLPDRNPDVPAKVLWASLKNDYGAPHRVQATRPSALPVDPKMPTLANGGLKFVPQGTMPPQGDKGKQGGLSISPTGGNDTPSPLSAKTQFQIDHEALLREQDALDAAPTRESEAQACDAVFKALPDDVTWPICTQALERFSSDEKSRQAFKRMWTLTHHRAAVVARMEAK